MFEHGAGFLFSSLGYLEKTGPEFILMDTCNYIYGTPVPVQHSLAATEQTDREPLSNVSGYPYHKFAPK